MHLKSYGDVLEKKIMSKTPKKAKMESTTRTWIAKPVLAPEFIEDPMYIEVYVGILKDKKTISRAIQTISVILPGFSHLKRCSNQKILLCPSQDNSSDCKLSPDDVKMLLRDKGFDLSLLEDKLEIISVPSKTPRTKIQAAAASKIWPVNFHPDIRLESIISGKEFNDNHLDSIEKCMKIVIEAAKREAVGNKNCTGSAMIIDPEEGNILVLASAKLNLHPMWHASMLAIDLVAKLQDGGAWELTQESNEEQFSGTNSMPEDYTAKEKRKFKEIVPLCYPSSLSDIVFPDLEPLTKKELQRRKDENNYVAKSKEGPYLCTGYWAFLLQEPCSLCAMALLHSRISKIFYGRTNSYSGVLGSKTVLHSLPGLNHRYQVWRGILESECIKVPENRS